MKAFTLLRTIASTALFGLVLSASLFAPAALAQSDTTVTSGTVTTDEMFGGASPEDFADVAGLGSGDLTLTIAAVIRALLGFMGLVAVFVVLLGGWKWIMSNGDEKKVQDAKKLMINGFIGIAVILLAYAGSFFILNSLQNAIANSSTL